MRDYKNVQVSRKYRTGATRVTVKRVAVAGSRRAGGGRTAGVKSMVLAVLGTGIAAITLWLGWQTYGYITRSEQFQIAGVDVQGAHELGTEALREIVGPFTGQNIFKVDLEAAARRARQNPWVREARVHRRLPNRITMEIVERVPRAVLMSEGARYLMDGDTTVIERLAGSFPAGRKLPVIVLRDVPLRPGEPVVSDSLNEALLLLADVEARGGWNLAEVTIKASSPESLSIVYADREFRMGSGRYAEKLRRLAEVMADVKQRELNIAYVDLRPETQAAVMVKDAARKPASNTRSQAANKRH